MEDISGSTCFQTNFETIGNYWKPLQNDRNHWKTLGKPLGQVAATSRSDLLEAQLLRKPTELRERLDLCPELVQMAEERAEFSKPTVFHSVPSCSFIFHIWGQSLHPVSQICPKMFSLESHGPCRSPISSTSHHLQCRLESIEGIEQTINFLPRWTQNK